MANTPMQAPNMWAFAPDLQAQQVALQRQQQMAEMLRQQAVTPIETGQMVTGAGPARAVPVTGMQALAKVLQGGIGGYMQRQNDAKGLELGQQMNGRMNTMSDQTLPPMAGTEQPAAPQIPQAPSSAGLVAALLGGSRPLSDGSAAPNRGPTNEAAAAMDNFSANPGQMPQPAPQAMPAPPDMATALRGAVRNARMMGNQDLANKLTEQAWSKYAPTEMEKNDRYLNVGVDTSRQLDLAKRLKEGTQSLLPGQTNIAPDGSKTVAPNFETGVAGGFDPSGNPFAREVPGSAGIAASHAGAIARAQSQNKLITVNTANGPMMMTEEQAVQQAGGATPQPGPVPFQFPPATPARPTGAAPTDLNHMTPEQSKALMAKAQAQFGLRPGATPGTSTTGPAPAAPPSAPGQVGIRLKTPAQEAQEMANIQLGTAPQLDMKKKEYADMADYGKALNGHLSDSQALLQRIAQSRTALTKFQAGGGGEARSTLATWAQAVPGMPTSVVDKIAGGDLSASQEFQKYAAQEALGTMQQALASDTGKGSQGNRVAMQLFIKNNPNIETDPRAIEKIFNFQTTLHNQLKEQADAYQKYKETPGNDPSKFPNYWASEAIKRGFVTPEIKSGYAKGLAHPPEVQSVLDRYK
jgi:hypothetical protein